MQIITPTGTITEGDASLQCWKVAPRSPEALGRYHISARSGLVAAPAADLPMFSFLWNHPNYLAAIEYLRIVLISVTPPTVAQEIGIYGIMVRQVSVGTGGQINRDPTIISRKYITYPQSAGLDPKSQVASLITMGNTGTMAAETGELDRSSFIDDMMWELVAGAAVPRAKIDVTYNFSSIPLYVSYREAISLRQRVAWATGTARLSVEMEWREVDPSEI